MQNVYPFNSIVGRAALRRARRLVADGLAAKALGDLETGLGDLNGARAHYDEAIGLYKQEQDQLGLANTLKALGDLESRLGHLDSAQVHYDEAIRLYKNEQNQLGLANTLRALGNLESLLGHLDGARIHYGEAIGLYKKEQNQLGLANVYQSMGDLLLVRGAVDQALEVYSRGLSLYESERDSMGYAYTLSEVMRCHHRLGNFHVIEQSNLAAIALAQAAASGTESVTRYVLAALAEVCDNDEDKVRALIGRGSDA